MTAEANKNSSVFGDKKPDLSGGLASEISARIDRMLLGLLPANRFMVPVWKQEPKALLFSHSVEMTLLGWANELISRLFLPYVTNMTLSTQGVSSRFTPAPFTWFERNQRYRQGKSRSSAKPVTGSHDENSDSRSISGMDESGLSNPVEYLNPDAEYALYPLAELETILALPAFKQIVPSDLIGDILALYTRVPKGTSLTGADQNSSGRMSGLNGYDIFNRPLFNKDILIDALPLQRSLLAGNTLLPGLIYPVNLALAKAINERAKSPTSSANAAEFSRSIISRQTGVADSTSGPVFNSLSDWGDETQQSPIISKAAEGDELVLAHIKENRSPRNDENDHLQSELTGPLTDPSPLFKQIAYAGAEEEPWNKADSINVPDFKFIDSGLSAVDRTQYRSALLQHSPPAFGRVGPSTGIVAADGWTNIDSMQPGHDSGTTGVYGGRESVDLALAPVARSQNLETNSESQSQDVTQESAAGKQTDNKQPADTDALAMEVYEILKCRFMIEKERSQGSCG